MNSRPIPGEPPNKALKLTRLSGCLLGGRTFGVAPSHAARFRTRRVARGNHPLTAAQLSAGVRRLLGRSHGRLLRLAGTAILMVLAACGVVDPCANSDVVEVPSPTGEHRVVIFSRDCGATTSIYAQASILKRSERFHAKPAWFVASSQANCFTCDRNVWVAARWLSPNQVELSYDLEAKVHLHEPSVGGVTVTYKPVQP